MASFQQILYRLFYKPVLELYLRSDSNISFDGFKLKIYKGVFHPKLFFSTRYLFGFLKQQKLKGLTFLEVGCGSGILSLLAHRMGARVTSLDIDPKAVENTQVNFSRNFPDAKNVTILQSNLFDQLTPQVFDFILVNPPYYFKKVEVDSHYAWYCGENGEYFEKFFQGVSAFMHAHTLVFMILEENCEIERIKSIALKNKIEFALADEKQIKWEKNFVFQLKKKNVEQHTVVI